MLPGPSYTHTRRTVFGEPRMINVFSLFRRSEAFQERLEQIRPRLYRMAYSWSHNAALADDLVQETLVKGLKNVKQLHDLERLDSWLFSILTNCWRDHFRQNKEMEDVDEMEDYRCVNESTPESEHAQSQIVSRVRMAVAKLPLGQRQVVTLVDLEEFSYIEVAAILEIPIGTVMSRLCRARQTLHTHLLELAPPQSAQIRQLRKIK